MKITLYWHKYLSFQCFQLFVNRTCKSSQHLISKQITFLIVLIILTDVVLYLLFTFHSKRFRCFFSVSYCFKPNINKLIQEQCMQIWDNRLKCSSASSWISIVIYTVSRRRNLSHLNLWYWNDSVILNIYQPYHSE